MFSTAAGYTIVLSFPPSPSRCVGKPLPGDRGGAGHPLEQRHRPGLGLSGQRKRRGHVLGVVLPESELRRHVEPRWALCAPPLRAQNGLLHRLPAAAPRGVPRPPAAAFQGTEPPHRSLLTELCVCVYYNFTVILLQDPRHRCKA